MSNALQEMITRGQKRLDEAQWEADAHDEMGEDATWQTASQSYIDTYISIYNMSPESNEHDATEIEGQWDMLQGMEPADIDVQIQSMLDTDRDQQDRMGPEDYEAEDDWHVEDIRTGTSASEDRWGEMAGLEPGEDEDGGWTTTDDGVRVNIPS
jgi:hypothetical protein